MKWHQTQGSASASASALGRALASGHQAQNIQCAPWHFIVSPMWLAATLGRTINNEIITISSCIIICTWNKSASFIVSSIHHIIRARQPSVINITKVHMTIDWQCDVRRSGVLYLWGAGGLSTKIILVRISIRIGFTMRSSRIGLKGWEDNISSIR